MLSLPKLTKIWRKGKSYQVWVCSLCFMIYWRMILCTVISFIFRPWHPIVTELFLWFPVSEPPQFHISWFGGFLAIVLLVNPTDVELSFCIGVWGCGQPISMNVLRSGIIFFQWCIVLSFQLQLLMPWLFWWFMQSLRHIHWVLVWDNFLRGIYVHLLCF